MLFLCLHDHLSEFQMFKYKIFAANSGKCLVIWFLQSKPSLSKLFLAFGLHQETR